MHWARLGMADTHSAGLRRRWGPCTCAQGVWMLVLAASILHSQQPNRAEGAPISGVQLTFRRKGTAGGLCGFGGLARLRGGAGEGGGERRADPATLSRRRLVKGKRSNPPLQPGFLGKPTPLAGDQQRWSTSAAPSPFLGKFGSGELPGGRGSPAGGAADATASSIATNPFLRSSPMATAGASGGSGAALGVAAVGGAQPPGGSLFAPFGKVGGDAGTAGSPMRSAAPLFPSSPFNPTAAPPFFAATPASGGAGAPSAVGFSNASAFAVAAPVLFGGIGGTSPAPAAGRAAAGVESGMGAAAASSESLFASAAPRAGGAVGFGVSAPSPFGPAGEAGENAAKPAGGFWLGGSVAGFGSAEAGRAESAGTENPRASWGAGADGFPNPFAREASARAPGEIGFTPASPLPAGGASFPASAPPAAAWSPFGGAAPSASAPGAPAGPGAGAQRGVFLGLSKGGSANFGFITPDSAGMANVFVHRTNLPDGLCAGDRVRRNPSAPPRILSTPSPNACAVTAPTRAG